MVDQHAASRFRHRLTLQQPALTPDGAGGYTRAWEDVATLWAELRPLLRVDVEAERLFSGKLEGRVTYRVLLRYRSGVTTEMRLLYEARTLNIKAVIDVGERGQLLEILAEEGSAS